MTTTNNAMTLPNVRAPESKEPLGECKVSTAIDEVIWELALKNPLWVFKAKNFSSGHLGTVINSFDVYCNSELLGHIGREYLSNSKGYGVKVSNDRIANSMKRGGSYKTEDQTKALAKIKKMFKPSSRAEVIEKAEGMVATVMSQERISKDRVVRNYESDLQGKAIAYVTKGPGYALFLEYARASGDTSVDRTVSMLETARIELDTITGVKDFIGTGLTALIIVDEGKYLVKILDNVQLYDETTLPEEFRAKLGMLKLVNKKQFVTDIGCRVSDEVFVIKRVKAIEVSE